MKIIFRTIFVLLSFLSAEHGAQAQTLNPPTISNVSLLASATSLGSQTYVYLQGYYSLNDGGQGLLFNIGTSGTTDNGFTFKDGGSPVHYFQRVSLNGDVRQWGAKCNGALNTPTDDSTFINNEINYYATTAGTGGIVVIPALTCAIDAPVSITGNGIEIRGAARGRNAIANGSQIMAMGSSAGTFDLIQIGSSYSNVAITDVTLGDVSTSTPTGGDAINAYGGPVGLVLRDLYINNVYNGIVLDGANTSVLDSIRIAGFTGQYGIIEDDSGGTGTNQKLTNIFVSPYTSGTGNLAGSSCFALKGASTVYFNGGTLNQCGYGIRASDFHVKSVA